MNYDDTAMQTLNNFIYKNGFILIQNVFKSNPTNIKNKNIFSILKWWDIPWHA